MRLSLTPALLAIALSVSLLAGCEKEAPPAPKPAAQAPAPKPVDPKVLEQQRLEASQKRVEEVRALLEKKHKEISDMKPIVSEVQLGKDDKSSEYLYEVITSQGVMYTNKTVDYIFLGSLLLGEGEEVQNFTARPAAQEMVAKAMAATRPAGQSEIFTTLSMQEGLNFTYGTGENKIIVFEDPDCPACQKLHQNLEEIGAKFNLSIKTFPFVLTNAHPNGVARAKALLCATDPSASWKKWMLHAAGQKNLDALWTVFAKENSLTSTDCELAKTVDAWQTMGQQLGLSATPTIMFETGMMAEGALGEKEFTEALAMVAEQKAALTAPSPSTPAPASAPVDPTSMLLDAPAPSPAPAEAPAPALPLPKGQ